MGLTTDLHRTYKGTTINPPYISNIAICMVDFSFYDYPHLPNSYQNVEGSAKVKMRPERPAST